jgi:hypothetical protein
LIISTPSTHRANVSRSFSAISVSLPTGMLRSSTTCSRIFTAQTLRSSTVSSATPFGGVSKLGCDGLRA